MKHLKRAIGFFCLTFLSIGPAFAEPFEIADVQITSVQVITSNFDTHLGDAATVFVRYEGQPIPGHWYTFAVDQNNPISAAMFNGLLSSFATGAPVTLAGERSTTACGCAGCPHEIAVVTIE